MFTYMHVLWLLAATVCAEEVEDSQLPCPVQNTGQRLHDLLTPNNCPKKMACARNGMRLDGAEETCACALRIQFEEDHVRVEYPYLFFRDAHIVNKPSTVETIKDLYNKSMNGHHNKWYCGQVWGEPFATDYDCDPELSESDQLTYTPYTQVFCVCTPANGEWPATNDGDWDCRFHNDVDDREGAEEGGKETSYKWANMTLQTEIVKSTISQSENSNGKEDGLYLRKCNNATEVDKRLYPNEVSWTYYTECNKTSYWTLSDPDKEQPDQILACLNERADDPKKDCSNIPQFAPNTTATTTTTSPTTTTTLKTTVVTIVPEQSILPESKTTISTSTNATTDDNETNTSNTTTTTSTTSTTIDEPSKTTSASNGTTNAPAAPNSESEPGASSKGWIAAIVVCLILLLIAAAVGVFFFLKKRKQQKEKEEKGGCQ